MRALAVIVALTLVASSAASSAGTVIELTDANFDEQVRSSLRWHRPPAALGGAGSTKGGGGGCNG